jgi:hypothetical protein
MMRYLVVIILFFFYGSVFAQADTKEVSKAAEAFHNALIKKDTVVLKQLLHDKLVYGHSNGWRETKREMLDNLYNGTIDYIKIVSTEENIVIVDKTACLRATLTFDVVMKGKALPFKLHSMQVWTKHKKEWKLLSRQSVKEEIKN